MINKDTPWYKRMLAKYGSDEAIAEIMARNGRQVKDRSKGGYHKLAKEDPEKLSEISRQAANKRWQNDETE